MEQGTVVRFAKGFGFIHRDGGGADVFFHWSSLIMDGFKTVEEGDRVSYEMGSHGDRVCALNVKVLEPAASASKSPKSAE
jgi:CspA family cold shock protein